jgi:hypothetical protein
MTSEGCSRAAHPRDAGGTVRPFLLAEVVDHVRVHLDRARPLHLRQACGTVPRIRETASAAFVRGGREGGREGGRDYTVGTRVGATVGREGGIIQ